MIDNFRYFISRLFQILPARCDCVGGVICLPLIIEILLVKNCVNIFYLFNKFDIQYVYFPIAVNRGGVSQASKVRHSQKLFVIALIGVHQMFISYFFSQNVCELQP